MLALCTLILLVVNLFKLSECKQLTQLLPTIDLSESDQDNAKILYNAATKYGFFNVINHGISLEITQQALEYNKKFFKLSMNDKMALLSNDSYWGYTQYQHEMTDSMNQKEGDTKEGFYIHHSMQSTTNYRQNQWPSSLKLPGFKSIMQSYMNEMYLLSEKIAELIALSLNLSSNFFKQPGIRDECMNILYLLHYSKKKSNPENGIFGTGQHTDYDLFTILLTDNNPGLQIFHENQFIHIEYKPNTFIVNIADTLQKWTNDIFKSALHRVVINGEKDRYSIPYFVAANYDLIINCLPNTVIPNHEKYSNCNHESFKSGDYLGYKLKQINIEYHSEL